MGKDKKQEVTLNTVDRKSAEREFETWCDIKRLRPDQRSNPNPITGVDDNKEKIISCIENGYLVVDTETGELTQKLAWPIDDGKVKELTFKLRLNNTEKNSYSVGLKPNDFEGKIAAIIAALTSEPRGIINKLDTSDRDLSDSIASFFL